MPVDEEGIGIGAICVAVELGMVVATADTVNFCSGIPQVKQ